MGFLKILFCRSNKQKATLKGPENPQEMCALLFQLLDAAGLREVLLSFLPNIDKIQFSCTSRLSRKNIVSKSKKIVLVALAPNDNNKHKPNYGSIKVYNRAWCRLLKEAESLEVLDLTTTKGEHFYCNEMEATFWSSVGSIKSYLANPSKLRVLNALLVQESTNVVIHEGLENLEELSVEGVKNYGATLPPKLRNLGISKLAFSTYLHWYRNVCFRDWETVAKLSHLHSLSITEQPLPRWFLENLHKNFPCLQELSLTKCKVNLAPENGGSQQIDFESLAKCRKLVKFSGHCVDGCLPSTDQLPDGLGNSLTVPCWPFLKYLNILGSDDLTTSQIVRNCPSLEVLIADAAQTITKDLTPLSALENLHTVDVQQRATGIDVTQLQGCKKLVNVTVGFDCCSSTHLNGLSESRDLRELYIYEAFVADITALRMCATSLEVLVLNSCRGVTDISVLTDCYKLRKLDIQRTQVSNISALANHLHLQDLDIGVTQVEDLRPLTSCPLLSVLIMRDTPAIVSSLHVLPEIDLLAVLNVSGRRADYNIVGKCKNLRVLEGSSGNPEVDREHLRQCVWLEEIKLLPRMSVRWC